MKRLLAVLAVCALGGVFTVALAGEFHTGGSLVCSDCHVAHYSQTHAYSASPSASFVPLGPAGPYSNLLRNEVNDLCLSCHDGQSFAPDVFGANGGTAMVRRGGGFNAAPGHRANDTGYESIDGHTLWSKDVAPGGTWSNTGDGLECTDCHAQHGHQPTQFRNLRTSTTATDKFYQKGLTYAVGANNLTKDVFQRAVGSPYADGSVDFNEPDIQKSAYGNWCGSCHKDFHGSGGDVNMGGQHGGFTFASPVAWKRHPVADVDIGHAGSAAHISSLSQFNTHANRVKVMDSQGLWNGTAADNTVTPSCFSCHRAHGTKNAFGLIFMKGSGTVTEDGDGGQLRDLCRQCHVQGG